MPLQPGRSTIINAQTVNATATVYSTWQKGNFESLSIFGIFTSATDVPSVDVYVDLSPYHKSETSILTQTLSDTTKYTTVQLNSAVITAETMQRWTPEDLSGLDLNYPVMSWRIHVTGDGSNQADTVATVWSIKAL